MVDSAFGSSVLVWNEDFQWSFIPWPFAMWWPFGSRECSFLIVAKDWKFLLEFHLRLIAVFSVSLAEWALVMFYSALCFVILRLGASRVDCSSLPHSLFLLSPCRFRYQSSLFNLLLPYPGVNPLASIVTLVCSFQLTQTSASMTVLICVVCLRFCFPHYSMLCLPDGLQYFCHGPFLFSDGCSWWGYAVSYH